MFDLLRGSRAGYSLLSVCIVLVSGEPCSTPGGLGRFACMDIASERNVYGRQVPRPSNYTENGILALILGYFGAIPDF